MIQPQAIALKVDRLLFTPNRVAGHGIAAKAWLTAAADNDIPCQGKSSNRFDSDLLACGSEFAEPLLLKEGGT